MSEKVFQAILVLKLIKYIHIRLRNIIINMSKFITSLTASKTCFVAIDPIH